MTVLIITCLFPFSRSLCFCIYRHTSLGQKFLLLQNLHTVMLSFQCNDRLIMFELECIMKQMHQFLQNKTEPYRDRSCAINFLKFLTIISNEMYYPYLNAAINHTRLSSEIFVLYVKI